MPFDAVFRLHRRTRPDKTAIIDGDRRIDYATLDRLIDGACHALHAMGVRREMLVGLGLADHAEHVIAMIALARIGAVILPMDCRWQTEEKRRFAAAFQSEIVLLEDDDAALPVAAGAPLLTVSAQADSADALAQQLADRAAAVLAWLPPVATA